jgi:beta-galactosidase
MYSVTLAKYPHWVDFDAASVKNMKGFIYTPRTDSSNGQVKDYEIYVSLDGKEWGVPVKKGTLERNGEPQKVMFDKPVKARYIRFRALSEQYGNDFASGAEFNLIAD